MKKAAVIFIFLYVVSAFLLESYSSAEGTVRIITDCSGARVEIPEEVGRVVSTNNAFCAFMTAMGLHDRLIGAHGSFILHSWTRVFIDDVNRLMMFGYEPAPEALYKADADLVVVNSRLYAEKLRSAGIPAIYFGYTDIDEMYYALSLMGEIFGDDSKSYVMRWQTFMNTTLENIAHDVAAIPADKRKSVYYVNASTSKGIYNTAGGGSFAEYWINTIGGELVTSKYGDISLMDREAVLSLMPDAVIISGYLAHQYKADIMNNPLWEEIPAVRNGEVHIMPTGLVGYEKFAVDLPILFTYSMTLLYPEHHSFDGVNELRKFYAEFYGRDFSDEFLANMLSCLNPDGTLMK